MSDNEKQNKIVIDFKNQNDTLGYIIPTYMRNVNSIIQMNQKISQVSWEKEGELVNIIKIYRCYFKKFQLLNNEKLILTREEKKTLKLLILKGVQEEKRGDLWFISSGANQEMKNNPGYYDFLVNDYPQDVELPNDKQIDLVYNNLIFRISVELTLMIHFSKIKIIFKN
jgi:hypothetical protein